MSPPPQVLCALAVSWGQAMVGGWVSFSSVALPKMVGQAEPGEPIQLDLDQGSWVASLFFIGNIAGCLAGETVNQVAFLILRPFLR